MSNFGKICGVTTAYETENYTSLATENNALNVGVCNSSHGIRDINQIFLETWANDVYEFDAAQTARLEELACSDALDNGPAVYAARTLFGWQAQCANNFQKSAENNLEEVPQTEDAISLKENMLFSIYPNPSAGEIYLGYDLGELDNATLRVYDLTGKIIHTEVISAENMVTQLPNQLLNAGVYLYHISNGNEMLCTGKFIIE